MSDKQIEHNIAVKEGYLAHHEDAYFDARPQLDTGHNRALFQAGFERAWQAAQQEDEPVGYVLVPVEATDEMLNAFDPKRKVAKGYFKNGYLMMLAAAPQPDNNKK